MTASKRILISLLLALSLQGCFRARTIDAGPQTVEATPTVSLPLPTVTSTPLPSPTIAPTETEVPPTPLLRVTITASGGNLYIRRGPGTEYDKVGLLSKGSSADVIGRDVLSRWAQVNIPGTDATGWVSMLTDFTQLNGDLNSVPDFTFTEWAEPAFIKNCTEHNMFIEPGEITLYSLWTNKDYLNEVQVDPGIYTFYDLNLPDEPQTETVDIREGETYYILVNGLGVKHNCP